MATLALLVLSCAAGVRAQPGTTPAPDPGEYTLTEALVIEGVGTGGRSLIQTDAVEALRVTGQWRTPKDGDELTLADGAQKKWSIKKAGGNGWLVIRAGGYACWTFEAPANAIMILEASGHASALVNGEVRVGDPYEYGWVRVPVAVKAGVNEVLLKSGRGRVRAKLAPAPADVFFNAADPTMPDLLVGEHGMFGAIIVVNATNSPIVGAHLVARIGDDQVDTPLPTLLPRSCRKARVGLPSPRTTEPGEADCSVSVATMPESGLNVGAPAQVKLAIKKPTGKHKRTFVSDIDGSVQYYSVVPPPAGTDLADAKALILSLHGASVEATSQAACYKQRDWCYVICPTNRRPYGFDWEDWGRLDALEVLRDARAHFKLDDRRTYLTGHSMGGHGAWNLGAQFPGTFCAIAPSAGWISFASYTGGRREGTAAPSPVEEILQRAACNSDTLALKGNLASQGIYILHGDQDDNVPVQQARTMREELGKFHNDFCYYERPGAGHWWGDECMDWPPLIEFLQRHTMPEEKDVRRVDFTTVNPGVSGRCHWVTIADQAKAFAPSRVDISFDPAKKRFTGKTENVAALSLDAATLLHYGDAFTIDLDGQLLENVSWNNSKAYHDVCILVRDGDKWSTAEAGGQRQPGLFKSAFRNKVVLVYGTHGTADENAAALAKARYDAEQFWYRGNGAIDIMTDDEIGSLASSKRWSPLGKSQEPPGMDTRNVILYGNADTNAAWQSLVGDACPVQVRRGSVQVGERTLHGDDLACVFVRPMDGEDFAMVGVVAGTGLAGMRLADKLPYFVSGVGVPDWIILTPDLLTKGAPGIKAAGFFGNDWSVEKGEAAWNE